MYSNARHKQTYQLITLLWVVSLLLLGGAFGFQYGAGLLPCKLCIWQRWPHGLIILVGLLGMLSVRPALVFALIAALGLINSTIAGYHVGVEQQFWPGPTSCSGNLDENLSSSEMLNLLLATPVVRCDEIAWSFLSLSMAGWNMLFSLAQAGLAIMGWRRL